MKTAYVICVNDSTEACVVDDIEKASEELKRLKKEHQKKISPCNEYDDVFFWHIHDVPIIGQGDGKVGETDKREVSTDHT